MRVFLWVLIALLAGCDEGSQMPPCSALIVIGTVTFDCDAAHLWKQRPPPP